MRRFLVTFFVLSIIATGGAFYWRTYLPEGPAAVARPMTQSARPSSELSRGADRAEPREVHKKASDRQDMAMIISIVSSVISAIAALAQTLITARAYRPSKGG